MQFCIRSRQHSRYAVALLLIFGSATTLAQAAPAPGDSVSAMADAAHTRDTAADVNRVMALFDVPGIAIAVVKDGRVLAARGFGVSKLGEAAPVDGQTLFEIAANSKAFTSATLATLVDEGKLGWDDPVTKYLPDFQMSDPYVTRTMTIRDLLANRSGLGEGAGDLMWWPSSTFSTDEIVHKLRFLPQVTGFRSGFTYEYLPYIVAGKIVAEVTGEPWGTAVRKRLLAPLGMTRTTTSLADHERFVNRSAPHSNVDGRLTVIKQMPMANAAGAMGISTSANDIAKWMTMLLDGGRLAAPGADGKERRLISAAQVSELFMPQTTMRVTTPKAPFAATQSRFAAYGLGFDLRDYQGVKLVSHRGWQFGAFSTVVLVPSANLGIAILTNTDSGPALTALRYRLIDRYLGLAPTDWIDVVAKNSREDEQTTAPAVARSTPSLALAAYDGDYRDPWYGTATIATVAGKQTLSFSRTPDMTGVLEHYQHDTFIVHWNERALNADAYVSFSLKLDGSIERMKMAPISASTDSSFDFTDLVFTPASHATVQ
ncbi:MAG: serine hydrolase [Pseudomonadota bacterium]|nr:serine hydrolase [Pseudomonadota bacterium]